MPGAGILNEKIAGAAHTSRFRYGDLPSCLLGAKLRHPMRRHLLPFLACLASGCGHPATVEECEEIIEQVARLELRATLGASNEKAILAEIDATKRELKDSTMKDCVGKRITNKALECVRNAATADEAAEGCFD